MTGLAWLVVAFGAGLVVAAALLWKPILTAWREKQLAAARQSFHRRREWLEARFLELAGRSGRPRGLRWVDCEFADGVVYARDRKTGQLAAFVAVTIAFEAIEGGGMEEVEAVGNLRAGTAVFRLARDGWYTEGRAVFNLNPTEAIDYYGKQIELVSQEGPHLG